MDFLNDAIVFLFCENALADGLLGIDDLINALYYKNTPAIMTVLDAIYEGFWEFFIDLLNKFV